MSKYNQDTDKDLPAFFQRLADNVRDLQRAVRAANIVPTTITTDYTVLDTDDWIINNKAATICTLTLLDPAEYEGYDTKINTWQAFGVQSASANIRPQVGGALTSTILAATAGKWAILKSDGVSWVIVQSN